MYHPDPSPETGAAARRRDHPLLLLALGALTGFLGGMLGIGGGVLLIPLLLFVVGLDQKAAQGTSLALSIPLVIVNCVNYYVKNPPLVFWSADATVASVLIGLGGVVGAYIGSRWALSMPTAKLSRLFAAVMAGAGLYLLIDGLRGGGAQNALAAPAFVFDPRTVAEFLGIGLVTGIASGLAGIGGAIVMVPLLTILLGMDQKYAQGLSVGAMLPIVAMGAQQYRQQQAGELKFVWWLAPGSWVGIALGGILLQALTSHALKVIFGGFLVIMAILRYRTVPLTKPSSDASDRSAPPDQ